MKFEVERASDILGYKPPCKEAIEADNDPILKTYTVEINSLEDLIEFIDKYGDIIISKPYNKSRPYVIEIYDAWRK